ncbi:DUF488 domain-containing protein [Hahella ganghwensis]|uniref:DUF488 domain-containing protein n=1 Tax=Hahella ganghwensis TaxID=286420 RepID=UPI000364BE48|nr:DUF488 domain-containing protein [Hahella ganghwensis]
MDTAVPGGNRLYSIGYVYLGPELGPRSKDPAHYDERKQVQFDRLMQADLFKSGISRLNDGMSKGYTIALSCAEKDPAICHRSLLVGWSLKHQYGIELQHILHDGQVETQTCLEHRLMETTETYPDMLMDESEAIRAAYTKQCLACAYRIPD